jgi:hypothetical protein
MVIRDERWMGGCVGRVDGQMKPRRRWYSLPSKLLLLIF